MGLNGTDGDAVGKEGFGIHGTIDPDSIGKEMSHGCIRLVNENVEQVYEMLIDGKSTIIIKE
jgi:L,D-transpeptidase ErfK/SrfK